MEDGDAQAAVRVDVGVVEGADEFEVWVNVSECFVGSGSSGVTYRVVSEGSCGGRSFWP